MLTLAALSLLACAPSAQQSLAAPSKLPSGDEIELLNLALPDHPVAGLSFQISLGSRHETILLSPDSSRAEEFRVRVTGAPGVPDQLLVPTPHTVTGTIPGMPGTIVSGSLVDGRLSAVIHDVQGGEFAVLEPDPLLPRDGDVVPHVIRPASSASPMTCGCDGAPGRPSVLAPFVDLDAIAAGQTAASNGPTSDLRIALDSLYETYESFNFDAAAMAIGLETIAHHASIQFDHQIDMRLRITELVIRTDNSPGSGYPYQPFSNYSSAGMAFATQNLWDAAPGLHEFANLFTPLGIGTSGGAQTGDICDVSEKPASWSRVMANNVFASIRVFMHEIAHGFSIGHSSTEGFAWLMGAPGISAPFALTLHPVDHAIALDWIANSQACFVTGSSNYGPPSISTITPSGTEIFPPIGEVVIEGTNLDGVFEVIMGGTILDYQSFEVVSPGMLRVFNPAGLAVGSVSVSVESDGGIAASSFPIAPVSTPFFSAIYEDVFDVLLIRVFAEPLGSAIVLYSDSPATTVVGGATVLRDRSTFPGGTLALDADGGAEWLPAPLPGMYGSTTYMQAALYHPGGGFAGATSIASFMIP